MRYAINNAVNYKQIMKTEKNKKIYSVLLYTIIGDALGSPLDGLSKGHIASTLKGISGYTDPLPALKGKTEKWKKPGLYSSLSQLVLLFSMSSPNGRFSAKKCADAVASSPVFPDSDSGVFRYPDSAVKVFIQNCINGAENHPSALVSHSLPILALHIGLFAESRASAVLNSCALAKQVTTDSVCAAGAAVYAAVIFDFMSNGINSFADMLPAAAESAAESLRFLKEESPAVFEMGINPDSLVSSAGLYLKAFEAALLKEREAAMAAVLNSCLASPAVRLTVPHPLALVPYSLCLSSLYGGDLFRIAEEGGACAVLTACAASFAGTLRGADEIPAPLVEGLVNRRRVLAVIESVSEKKAAQSLMNEFMETELSLTAKAFEELRARNKNSVQKKAKPANREAELAKHVVESWTKLDKAKWKMEKRKDERKQP